MEFTPFVLSFKLALITTVILFIIALPLAWYLSQTRSKMKPMIEAVTALPIVLPPSVLGFYILWAFSQNSPVGAFLQEILLVWSWHLLLPVLWWQAVFTLLPFMVQPLQGGFESLNKHMLEASYISGKSKWVTIWKVALPNIKPALLTALIVTFAHTVGEFGVVLMVGGKYPRRDESGFCCDL